MNVENLMGELADALRTIDPLEGRVLEWDAAQVNPDCAIVDLPETGDYDVEAYRSDTVTLSFMVLSGRMNDRSAARRLAGYVSRNHPNSVKVAVDGFAYTTCDDLTVTGFETVTAVFGTVAYLGAQFSAKALGKGA